MGEGNAAGTFFGSGLDWKSHIPEVISPAGTVVRVWDKGERVDVVIVNFVVADDGLNLEAEIFNQHLGVDLVVEEYLAGWCCSKKANRVCFGGVDVDEDSDGVVFWRVDRGVPTVGGFIIDMTLPVKHRVNGPSKGTRNTMDTSVDFILIVFTDVSTELCNGLWGVVSVVHHGASYGPFGGDLVDVGFSQALLGEEWWKEEVVDPEVDGGSAKEPSSPLTVD